jgi:hypothetical protein
MIISDELERIGDAVIVALSYKYYPLKEIDSILQSIDTLTTEQENISKIEEHFKSSGSSYVLFFLSNIIYNLKTKNELHLTPDVVKWLGSVWKNFLRRNKSYQELNPLFSGYRESFKKYYPGETTSITKIDNVQIVKEDFIDDDDPENSKLKNLEKFYQVMAELLSWMKPTYYVLLDYYYEVNLKTGVVSAEAGEHEKNGLAVFGHENYSYWDICFVTTQALGVLEALYLTLKKKKTSRQIINVDGKSRFLSVSEIYDIYRDRFNQQKEELVKMKKRN